MQPQDMVAEEQDGARDFVERQCCRNDNVRVVDLRLARVPRVQGATKVED